MNTYQSSSSRTLDAQRAAAELLGGISAHAPPSFVAIFASPQYGQVLADIAQRVSNGLQTAKIMGCTGESIVVGNEEVEDEPCICIWAAWWPDAQVELSHVTFVRGDASFSSLPDVSKDPDASLLLLAEPFSFPADVLLSRWNEERAGIPVLGGIASGATGPGELRLLMGGQVFKEGAIVAAIRGVPITSVVSQGCRPIGDPWVITKAERNVIFELGGKPAHEQLKTVHDRLPTRDKDLMRKGLHLGRVVNEYQESFELGDFLIRNVTSFDPEDGSITLGDYYRAGQTVQFHLRDSESASHDLETLLRRGSNHANAAKAALLFTCNGRGTRLFEKPHHDASKVQQIAGPIPCAGFFCAGEIGPIGSQTFLHGFTASVVLFG